MRILTLTYIFLFFCNKCFCKSHYSDENWYFGYNAGNIPGAGLKFYNDTIITLTDGKIATAEGCAALSDRNGNLLLYSDGVKVWDKNHNLMPNGSGLLGDWSSTTSVYITPVINDTTKFYLFTVDGSTCNSAYGPKGKYDGLNYSIIDLKLKGNGTITQPLGDINVNSKNILLVDSTAEKITAIKHANGIYYWIVTKKCFTSEFYAFLVTEKGICSIPIISIVGSTYISNGPMGSGTGMGYMVASHDGKNIVCAEYEGHSQLFDFDPFTGVISNARNITKAGNVNSRYYGAAFSPNDSLIYLSGSSGSSTLKGVFQYKRHASDIAGTEKFYHIFGMGVGGMRTREDGFIYIASWDTGIHILRTPNLYGDPSIEVMGISLNGKRSAGGLPMYFDYNSNFQPTQQFINWKNFIIESCNTDSLHLKINMDNLYEYLLNVNGNQVAIDSLLPLDTGINIMIMGLMGPCYSYSDTFIWKDEPCDDKIDFTFDYTIFIPNSFTPNGDGINDFLKPILDESIDYSLIIFDKYGKVIIELNQGETWDGRYHGDLISPGVYGYVCQIKEESNYLIKGNVTITY